MIQPFRSAQVFPDLDCQVLICESLPDPWINMNGGGILSINPNADRSTASRLRTLADELDEAYKILDARESAK
jgi:hypothetical protein